MDFPFLGLWLGMEIVDGEIARMTTYDSDETVESIPNERELSSLPLIHNTEAGAIAGVRVSPPVAARLFSAVVRQFSHAKGATDVTALTLQTQTHRLTSCPSTVKKCSTWLRHLPRGAFTSARRVGKAFRRGVPIFVIATTLLAMVDAAPSPKCAVNVQGRKNEWSDKHYPEVVYYDPMFLNTLDDGAFKDGSAEIAKVAIIGSESLFYRLESHSLSSLRRELCSEIAGPMLAEAALLFFELKWTGPYYGNKPASIRSFGHGFERELETHSGFSVRHGSAVAVEMFVATRLARNLGKMSKCDCARIQALLSHLDLPASSEFCDPTTMWGRAFHKRWDSGKEFYYPIPTRIGVGGFLDRFSRDDLTRAINELE